MISKDCISIRRKQIRNITARLLKEDNLVEPRLQQVTGETLHSDGIFWCKGFETKRQKIC